MMNPANTLWEKPYNVYAKSIPRPERFLEFETWWGSPVLLNAGEMQWIADNLFVGNKLSAGVRTCDGCASTCATSRADHRVLLLRRRHHAAAAGAGLDPDLYDRIEDRSRIGQTIVYTCTRASVISASSSPARWRRKEHEEFAIAMDMIDMVPPGLYEAVITEVGQDTAVRS